jgi:uncharacterized protein YjbI with pentapeptide repeats
MALDRDSVLVRLLREEKVDDFNEHVKSSPPQLDPADLRMVDLRRADLVKANLRGAYLRNADLRGVDLSDADLSGASLHDARISGCLFPASIPAEEITLSISQGTRMRSRPAAEAARQPQGATVRRL